jgi:excisionase family DNA binding protein
VLDLAQLPSLVRRVCEIERRLAEPPSEYLTAAEAAGLLRSSRQRVYDLVSAGRLSRFRDGRRLLLSRVELEAYLRGER